MVRKRRGDGLGSSHKVLQHLKDQKEEDELQKKKIVSVVSGIKERQESMVS